MLESQIGCPSAVAAGPNPAEKSAVKGKNVRSRETKWVTYMET